MPNQSSNPLVFLSSALPIPHIQPVGNVMFLPLYPPKTLPVSIHIDMVALLVEKIGFDDFQRLKSVKLNLFDKPDSNTRSWTVVKS